MSEEEITDLVNEFFREKLGAAGFRESEVTVKTDDDDGSEYLNIFSYFDPARTPLTPEASLEAIRLLRHKLFAHGEDRFPVVVHILPETSAA